MRSFIYLDEQKMYSLSSQLMEGVTDFVLRESRQARADTEEQKGPVDSGKKMAGIIESTSSSFEKKFLHDYAYSIFETRLIDDGKLEILDETAGFDKFDISQSGPRLVKVKAKAKLIDAAATAKALESLVEMLQCLSILSVHDDREALVSELLTTSDTHKSRKSQLLGEIARLSKPQIPKEKAAHDLLHYENMAKVLTYGYKSRLDIFMQLADCVVSADLKRSSLKDEEDFIVKTYSRVSDVDLVLVGILTRTRSKDSIDNTESSLQDSLSNSDNMNEVLLQSSQALHSLEKMFTKLDSNHVVLDPIAVYVDL